VYAVSGKRDGFLAGVTSRLFYFALRRIFRIEIIRDQLMMRIMSRRFCECYKLYPEVKRTVASIVHDIGMPYAVVQVQNRNRAHGKSNYGFTRRVSLFIDVVLSLTNNPLDVMIYLGLLIFGVTVLASSYYLWRSVHASALTAVGATILSIAFFGSLMLLTLGIMGRYLSNIYAEVRRRPLFFVDKSVKVDVEI
jgi:energy-converting hydrogenase Eha subunit C